MRRRALAATLLIFAALRDPFAQGPQPGQPVSPTPAQPARPLAQPGPTPTTTPRQPPPQTGTSILRGLLLDAVTGAPIRRGRVSTTEPLDRRDVGSITDGEGRFELRDLPAGRYTLDASRAGYLSLRFSNGGKPVPPLAVGEGETVDKIVLRLTRGGVITGQVVDDLGAPVPGVRMNVLRRHYVEGQRQLSQVYLDGPVSVVTDDLGGYRIYGLEPGEYYVSARPPEDFFFAAQAANGAGPALTYYPGTANAAEATRVAVRAGRETQGVTFATAVTRLARIRGRAVTSGGEPFVGSISVRQRDLEGSSSNSVAIRGDGTFEIGNLPPGRYLINTRSNNYARTDDPGEMGRLVVTLNGEDLSDVLIVAAHGGVARGRIVTDEGIAPAFDVGPAVYAMPVDPALPSSGPSQNRVRDDFTFEIKGLFDRMHLVPGMPFSESWSFKSVLLNGLDVTDSGIEFRPGRTVDNIEIVYTRKTSYLSGTVLTDQLPVTDTWIVVFPADESKWVPLSRWLHATRTGEKGQFRIVLVPGDDYLAAAVTGLESGQHRDPEFLKAVKDLATRVSIDEGATRVLDLKIVEWRK